jgi:hypothetical protein
MAHPNVRLYELQLPAIPKKASAILHQNLFYTAPSRIEDMLRIEGDARNTSVLRSCVDELLHV